MGGETDTLMPQERTDFPTTDVLDNIQVENLISSESSSYADPIGSELSLSEPNTRGTSPGSKKRKSPDQQIPRSRLKRLRTFYNDEYRKLLNETVDQITKTTSQGKLKPLGASQIGVTSWSAEEKEIFFSALATKGRDDLSEIATAIGTKNELEVHVYLQLLQKATEDHHLHDRRQQLLGLSDIPGTLEISKDCCDALDLAADSLVVLQEKREHDSEINKHGRLGVLDMTTAQWIEDRLHEGENGESKVLQVLPAAKLLNLKSYLKLSSHLLMNSNDPEYNWRSYSGRYESPSILHTAFSDFHNLAVSITRRLIQSSLFFAMSRLRAVNTSNYTHQQQVRRQDIIAALNVLGMEHNARNYWAKVTKRCNVDVYEDLGRKTAKGEKLSYEEVERRLNEPRKYKTKSGATSPQDNDTSSPKSVESPAHESDLSVSEYPSEHLSDATASPDEFDDSHQSRNTNAFAQERLEQNEDAYAEALDVKASRIEEQRLWKMLGQEAPESIKHEETELPKDLGAKRKSKEDLEDWRCWVDYVGEWEVYDMPVLADEFAANQWRFKSRRPGGSSADSAMTSRLAGGSDEDVRDDGIYNEEEDEDTSLGDQVMLEDDEGSDLFGVANKMSPATNVEVPPEKSTDKFKDQEEDSNGSDYITDEEEDGESHEGQDEPDPLHLDSGSGPIAEESENLDPVLSDTTEEELLDASDVGVDSEWGNNAKRPKDE